jgi:signal transduction histidine kinase
VALPQPVPAPLPRRSLPRDLVLLLALFAASVDAILSPASPLLALLAGALALFGFLRQRKDLLAFLVVGAVAVNGARVGSLALASRHAEQESAALAERHLKDAQRRLDGLLGLLTRFASRVADLPDAPAALGGDKAAVARVFASLEEIRGSEKGRETPSLGIHTLTPTAVAWSGRISEVTSIGGSGFDQPREAALLGSVTTTLLVMRPIRSGGSLAGVATAELTVAVHRNIHNGFLQDFDLLQGGDSGLQIRYVDSRDPAPAGREGERALVSGERATLAVASAIPPSAEDLAHTRSRPYEDAFTILTLLALGCWASRAPRRVIPAVVASRLLLVALGVPFVRVTAAIVSPGVYASTLLTPSFVPGLLADLLAALLGSPLDFFLTNAAFLAIGLALAVGATKGTRAKASPLRALAADLLTLPVLYLLFAFVADTQSNATVDVEAISLIPQSLALLLLQLGVLMLTGAGLLLLLALQLTAGPSPSRRAFALRVLLWIALGALLYREGPDLVREIPLTLALVTALLPIGIAFLRDRWVLGFRGASGGSRAAIALVGTAVSASLLYPVLVFYEARAGRAQIERDYAPKVLHEPQWRAWVLQETERQIDALPILGEPLPTSRAGDLAFAVWSRTELAAVGCSSAVEIQDSSGLVVSRFALNLPTLETPWKMLPETDGWGERRESLTLASTERPVHHAERLLRQGSEVYGAIHVYVGEDFWNLPFVTAADPYFELYRTATGGAPREHNISLVAWDQTRATLFSSVERPPSLDAGIARAVQARPAGEGLWGRLTVDQEAETAYFFRDEGGSVYALSFPRRSLGRLAGDFVEAVSGLTLATLVGLLVLMLLRTLLGRKTLSFPALASAIRHRFALRLFVSFLAVAVAPVVLLEGVVRGFVAGRLEKESRDEALERAAFARKAVEDAFWFQRDEAASGRTAVTDAALVWISTLIKGDLDLFESGKLLASSKRELYASGLLPPWVPGQVYRAIALEAQPAVLREDMIGSFRFLEVSVPVRTRATPEPWILSIPLALRQREMDTALRDLDRTIRLGLVLFLTAAALLAQSVSRRISGPISALTKATRQVAEGDLDARVLPTSHDELSQLVESFNQMASDLERQRRDLEQTNRLAAWAEMAQQVAHEVKNPLTPIQLSAEHLKRVYSDRAADFGATLDSCVATILRQVRTLRGIVGEFSALARPPSHAYVSLDLLPLVRAVSDLYAKNLPPGITLSVETEPVPKVSGDARLLERAIVNLLENALQAVGEKGQVVVRLRRRAEKARVEIEVEDSGPGVEPEVLRRVFEPFFSTKTSGSGLGLAIVKKTLEEHGGGVSLETRPGCTRALVWLPEGGDERRGSQ